MPKVKETKIEILLKDITQCHKKIKANQLRVNSSGTLQNLTLRTLKGYLLSLQDIINGMSDIHGKFDKSIN